TNEYGSQTPTADAGSTSGSQSISAEISALGVNTHYHYRVVATDASGTTFGDDVAFTTLGRYDFSNYIGSTGTGAGQFNAPRDVAVDLSSGDMYVADSGNHRVVKLDPNGNFILAWGWGVSDGGASAEICTTSCQAGISGTGAGQFQKPDF